MGVLIGSSYGSLHFLLEAFKGPLVNFKFFIVFFNNTQITFLGMGLSFWIFSIGSFIGIIFTYFIIPETKGISMAEIQKMLNGDFKKNKNLNKR